MKISGNKAVPALLAFFFLTSAVASGAPAFLPVLKIEGREYISLNDVIRSLDPDNFYDTVTRRGKLYRGTSVLVYQVGMSTVLSNSRMKKYAYPVISKNGEILFPVKAGGDFLQEFYPDRKISREDGRFVVAQPGSVPAVESPPAHTDKNAKTQPVPPKDRISFIIIDAGHGGKDPGAIGKGSAKEKEITLSLAVKLEKYFREHLKGVRIILTRKRDSFIELARRTDIANSYLKENENGLFISIHVNASLSPRISGFETYFLSQNASNEDARATAALENNVIVLEDARRKKSYDDVEHIEAFMYTAQVQKESSLLAEAIQSGMNAGISEFKSRSVKKADFFVLRGSLMPAVLVEVGYITHEKEAAMLRKDGYQDKIARGIGAGTIAFLKKYNDMIKK